MSQVGTQEQCAFWGKPHLISWNGKILSEKMIFIRIIGEGWDYRSRRQVGEQRFSIMTPSLEVVSGGGRVGQSSQGCDVEGQQRQWILETLDYHWWSPCSSLRWTWLLLFENLSMSTCHIHQARPMPISSSWLQVKSYPFSLWNEADNTPSVSWRTSLNAFTQAKILSFV